MRFEWDERKAAGNLTKHGVSFDAARDAFLDPHALTEPDYTEADEERWRMIGMSTVGVLFVVFTERTGDVIRIISARRATRHEQNCYYRKAFPEG